MLDDIKDIPKATFVLFGIEVFLTYEGEIRLRNIQTLIYEFALPWRANLVYLQGQKLFASQIIERCNELGFHFDTKYQVAVNYNPVAVKEFINLHAIVYAPSVLKAVNMQPVLRTPYNDIQAVESAAYFSKSMEPFTPGNYNIFLSRTH